MLQSRKDFLNIMPDHSVDVVLVTMIEGELNYLLTQRVDSESDPFPNAWGLAGVYLNSELDENYETAAVRALKIKAHLSNIPELSQLQSFGNAKRDPRHWTGTLVFLGYVPENDIELKSEDIKWVPISKLNDIKDWAFDHKEIIEYANTEIKKQAQYSISVISLLGEKFTQPQLQELYEVILQEKIDKSSFRKQIKESELLQELEGEKMKPKKGAPAQVYKLNSNFEGFFFPRSIAKKNKKL
jgi:8-oxo-dGTP diphosphatase